MFIGIFIRFLIQILNDEWIRFNKRQKLLLFLQYLLEVFQIIFWILCLFKFLYNLGLRKLNQLLQIFIEIIITKFGFYGFWKYTNSLNRGNQKHISLILIINNILEFFKNLSEDLIMDAAIYSYTIWNRLHYVNKHIVCCISCFHIFIHTQF